MRESFGKRMQLAGSRAILAKGPKIRAVTAAKISSTPRFL
jgi:hypothetical protein